MFRAGSTYMFNKFRSDNGVWTYYEPLHHDIARLKPDMLDIWKYSKKATNIMNHPELDKPHFYEYKNAFDDDGHLPYYDVGFAYEEYSEPPAELALYIKNLISSTPDKKLPVLQLNRSSLRLEWFKDSFPDGLHVYLLRNPINQFESYLQRGKIGKNIFLALNILIIIKNKILFPDVLNDIDLKSSDDLSIAIQEAMDLSGTMSIKEHYVLFLHIWFSSFVTARAHADFILDMDKIAYSPIYEKEVEEKLATYEVSAKIDFNDYIIKRYSTYSMSFEIYDAETISIYDYYAKKNKSISNDFTYYYIKFFISVVPQKGSFLTKLFRDAK